MLLPTPSPACGPQRAVHPERPLPFGGRRPDPRPDKVHRDAGRPLPPRGRGLGSNSAVLMKSGEAKDHEIFAQNDSRRDHHDRGTKLFNFSIRVQAFTLRWWVLGMRMSSRYFATVRRVTQ
jgi:hypothetical protein